jgi:hypothetical protein
VERTHRPREEKSRYCEPIEMERKLRFSGIGTTEFHSGGVSNPVIARWLGASFGKS